MRCAYEMSAPPDVHHAQREKVVAARWRKQPQVDLEMEEAASAVFKAEAMVVRDMAC
jgi:hypothetical protein